MNLYSQDSGSKVNGLGQSLQPFWANCILQHVPLDVGGRNQKKDGVEVSKSWLPKRIKVKAFGLKLINHIVSISGN